MLEETYGQQHYLQKNTASQNGVDFVTTPYNPNFESFPKEKQIIFFVCKQFN